MAIFQLEIADDDVSRVFDAICSNYGYQANIANPDYVLDTSDPENPVEPVDGAQTLKLRAILHTR